MRAPVVRRVAVAGTVGGLVPVAFAVSVAPGSAAGGAREELRFQDPVIAESSGLVVRGRDVLTVNDSGGEPVVYVVDAASGETVGRTTYASEVVDVEALAAGPDGTVWVGDIGDNDRVRPEISLYRIASVSRGDRTVAGKRFDLVYPDGARDAEALLVDPLSGQVYVVTKGPFGGEVHAAPRALRPEATNRLRPVGTAGGLVTDGTFLPDGGTVVLRDYRDGLVVDPVTWEERGSFPLPRQRQGEGIATWPGGPAGSRVLVSSEGVDEPLWSVPVPQQLLPDPEPRADRQRQEAPDDGSSPAGEEVDREQATTDQDEPAAPAIPLGPAVAGGVVLVVLVLGAFWLLRRRVRR